MRKDKTRVMHLKGRDESCNTKVRTRVHKKRRHAREVRYTRKGHYQKKSKREREREKEKERN